LRAAGLFSRHLMAARCLSTQQWSARIAQTLLSSWARCKTTALSVAILRSICLTTL
ncbi:hypothetical protein IW146_009343, partial [Coemansia sp. RSA 922]